MNEQSLSLPFKVILNIVEKLTTVFSNRLGKMLVLNVNFALRMMYAAATPFIHPVTQAKTKLFSASEVS